MPGTLQSSTNSTPFADVIDVIKARLTAGVTGAPVRIVAVPEDQLHQYEAQDGLLVHIGPPVPFPKCGAGRYNTRVSRLVTVVVLTQSMVDAPGEDIAAVKTHVAREESVANALHLIGPVGAAYNLRTGVMIEWTGGGEDIARQIKGDAGMLKGSLQFRVEYISPMQVTRD